MNVLFACSEAVPLIKTGGLADVCGALPQALKLRKQTIRLVMPAYCAIKAQVGECKTVANLKVPGYSKPLSILKTLLPGTKIPLYLVDAPELFERAGNPYVAPDGQDWQDNALRFTVFNRAIVEIAQNRANLRWQPDVVHCHDWQTGLTPALLSLETSRPRTIFTVHNLAYMGRFDYKTFNTLSLPTSLWDMHAMEFHDSFTFIKGGLSFADKITTVSPSYAREITTTQYGYGLDALLRYRRDDLHGILNGIDYELWNPQNDTHLPAHYSIDDLLGKTKIKALLQKELGLKVSKKTPIFSHIGRMVEQKGIDLIISALDDLLRLDVQVVILGSGDSTYENRLRDLALRYPDKLGLKIGFDEGLAHRIEAGSDVFLMPSRFEPCGLNQMYSLRYGTIPIVTATGGLADSVVDVSEENLSTNKTATAMGIKAGTGFVMKGKSALSLLHAINRALLLYQNPDNWAQLQHNAMSVDLSWTTSAAQYEALYLDDAST